MFKKFIAWLYNKWYETPTEAYQRGWDDGRKISNTLYISTIDKEKAISYNEGYNTGYAKCREETLREVYEKLCKEIEETARQKFMEEIKTKYGLSLHETSNNNA